MTSYNINVTSGVLQVSFDKDNPVTGDRIVKDAQTRIEELIASKVLTGGDLLKINGRMSLPVSYTIAHELGHLYSAIAVFDPRLKAYVVVISTNPEYQLGDRISAETNIKSSLEESNNDSSFLVDLTSVNTSEGGHPQASDFKSEERMTLKVGFNPQVIAQGDRIVRDTATQIEKLLESGRLKGKLLKISGRASVLASFVIVSKIAHCYGAIALFEPKEGDTNIDRYIVAVSHGTDYRVGDILNCSSSTKDNIKVVLCGAPNTGKTVLRDSLKKAIRQKLNKPDDFFYVISGCPDGDYNWMSETDLELAKKLKQEYKAKFTSEFAVQKAQEIKNIKNPLLLFDIGGKITPENELITSFATHAIILAKNEREIEQWQEFCQKLNLKVIAIVNSDYEAKEDKIETTSPIFKGSVHYLERGENTISRPTVQALAQYIINLVTQ